MASLPGSSNGHWSERPPTEIVLSPGALFDSYSPLSPKKPRLSKPLPDLPLEDLSIPGDTRVSDPYTSRGYRKHCAHGYGMPREDAIQSANRSAIVPDENREHRYSPSLKTFLAEEFYGTGIDLARENHYFREKKWDIFPELAPLSLPRGPAHHGSLSGGQAAPTGKRQQKEPNDHPENAKLNLGIIHTFIHKALSRRGFEDAQKGQSRKTGNSPVDSNRRKSVPVVDEQELQEDLADLYSHMFTLSLSPRTHPRLKFAGRGEGPGASVYQKRWCWMTKDEKKTEETLKEPPCLAGWRGCWSRLRQRPTLSISPNNDSACISFRMSQSIAKHTRPLTLQRQKLRKALPGRTTHTKLSLLVRLRKKEIESDQGRAELKRQIRVVGPIEQFSDGTFIQWF